MKNKDLQRTLSNGIQVNLKFTSDFGFEVTARKFDPLTLTEHILHQSNHQNYTEAYQVYDNLLVSMDKDDAQLSLNDNLLTVLEWVRPARTEFVEQFHDWLIERLRSYGVQPDIDGYGNIWVKHESRPKTLFTAHTDTVASCNSQSMRQEIYLDYQGIIGLVQPDFGSVLGADDGAGLALMLEMIRHGTVADFVFFLDEEIGGQGSSWAAQHMAEVFQQYQAAIAFDRRGTTNVITHQAGGRCCSDTFARSLADKLGLGYAPDDSGIFTDTANLTHLIPECTNLSVGYHGEHHATETLDYQHWSALRDRLIQIQDWDTLPIERNPDDVDDAYYRDFWRYDDFGYDAGQFETDYDFDLTAYEDEIAVNGFDAALDLVYNQPEVAAHLLTKYYCG